MTNKAGAREAVILTGSNTTNADPSAHATTSRGVGLPGIATSELPVGLSEATLENSPGAWPQSVAGTSHC